MAKIQMPEKSGTSLDNPLEKKEVTKVTKGKIKTSEKSALRKLGESFIEDDFEDIKVYVWSDVIIPAIKNLIFDSLIGSVEMALFGTSSRSRKGGRTNEHTTSYASYYKSGGNSNRGIDNSRSNSRLDYQSIIFEERIDAEEVLSTLQNLIEDYGKATIGDFYDAAGMTPDNNFAKNEEYGWDDLSRASIKRNRDGYIITLPREKYLG